MNSRVPCKRHIHFYKIQVRHYLLYYQNGYFQVYGIYVGKNCSSCLICEFRISQLHFPFSTENDSGFLTCWSAQRSRLLRMDAYFRCVLCPGNCFSDLWMDHWQEGLQISPDFLLHKPGNIFSIVWIIRKFDLGSGFSHVSGANLSHSADY